MGCTPFCEDVVPDLTNPNEIAANTLTKELQAPGY
jgi:hypothetical protein